MKKKVGLTAVVDVRDEVDGRDRIGMMAWVDTWGQVRRGGEVGSALAVSVVVPRAAMTRLTRQKATHSEREDELAQVEKRSTTTEKAAVWLQTISS